MKHPTARPVGRLRVIGGQWRSRLIEVPDAPALRPTPDRVRQTAFDWLAPVIEGARVLDSFAGTGALGIEALSRGAGRAIFLDSNPEAVRSIEATLARLGAGGRASVHRADAIDWLRATPELFDVVFLDPPFASDLLEPALRQMPRVLASGGFAYIECRAQAAINFPEELEWHRRKKAGQVSYGLAALRGRNVACP